jgi:MFS family permease
MNRRGTPMENKKKSSYSIVIAVACCLIVFGGAGTVFSTAGIFYSTVADAFGVGRGTFSIYMTIVCLVMSFSLPLLGKLLIKMDIRKVLALDGVCITVSWVVFALAQNMWMFYAAAVLQGFGVAGPMYSLVPTMASRWFHKKNGTMIGICMAFTGIAGIVLQPVLGGVISAADWRAGYWVNAALSGVLVIIPSLFMLRSNPSDVGQVPYGFEEEAKQNTISAAAKATPSNIGVTLKTAMRSKTFYTLAIVAGAINIYTCVNFYWASYATAIGYTLTVSATISSVAMYGQLIGKIGLGSVSDKNLNLGLILAYGCGFVGLIIALFTDSSAPLWILLVCIFLYGITHGSAAVETPIIAKSCFGNGKDYAQIYSNIAGVGSFCSAIGSTLFGYIVDWTGGYEAVFIIGIVLSALCFIMAKVSISSSKKLPRE